MIEMVSDLGRAPLLDLRRSEKKRLATTLRNGDRADQVCFWQNIVNTLSQFTFLLPENEEQIYFFGAAMREIVDAAGIDPNEPLPEHQSKEVRMAFIAGFLRYPISEALKAVRSHRAMEGANALRVRSNARTVSKCTLVEDVRASLVPNEKP
ncbi:hypothetical protein [Bradyrhizobium lupini]